MRPYCICAFAFAVLLASGCDDDGHPGDAGPSLPFVSLPGQDQPTQPISKAYLQTGVIGRRSSLFMPRELTVLFLDGTSQWEMEAVLQGCGLAQYDQSVGLPRYFKATTPLGLSLNEAIACLRADPRVEAVGPNWRICICAGTHSFAESSGGGVWLFPSTETLEAELDEWTREWIVEVVGIEMYDSLEGAPAVEVTEVRPLGPNILTLSGTVAFDTPATEAQTANMVGG